MRKLLSMCLASQQDPFLKGVLFLIAGIFFVLVFSLLVPYNMDEFIHYDTIICHLFPYNDIHNQCDIFKLTLPGTNLTLPLRAYHYSGSAPALLYAPLYLLWPSPLSARLLNFLLLAAGGWVVARIFDWKPWKVILPLLLFFPYVFQHLVDTGPVSFHIFSVYALYLLLQKWVWKPSVKLSIAIGALILFALWTKFSYFWLLPGIFLFFCIHALGLWRKKERTAKLRSYALQALLIILVFALPLTLLLFSTDPFNPELRPYLNQLLESESYSLSELFGGQLLSSNILRVMLHPLEATHRIYTVYPKGISSLLYSLLHYLFVPLSLLLLLLIGDKKIRRALLKPFVLYVSFLLTVVMIARTKDAGLMHHAVLSFPFLVLSTVATITILVRSRHLSRWKHMTLRGYFLFAAIAFVALNLFFIVQSHKQPLLPSEHPSKRILHHVLESGTIAERYIVVVVDWGMFYYQGLYGPVDQSVLFLWGLKTQDQIEMLRSLAAEHDRKLLFLYTTHETAADLSLINASFPLVRCTAVEDGAVWQMIAEPDTELLEACERIERLREGTLLDLSILNLVGVFQ